MSKPHPTTRPYPPPDPSPLKPLKRDILTPAIVIFGVVIVIMFLWIVIAAGQTQTQLLQ